MRKRDLRRSLRLRTVICSFLLTASPAFAIIDVNGDGLDDVWQERFAAGSLTPEGDADSDGQTNLEECAAGTDPFDSDAMHQFTGQVFDEAGTATVTWETMTGKLYQMEIADVPSTADFVSLGPGLHGTGDTLNVKLAEDAAPKIIGAVFHEVWVGVRGMTHLVNKFASAPSATQALTQTQIPSGVADYYGGRLRGYLVAPTTGSYTFHITGNEASEFWLGSTDSPDTISKLAEVLESQTDVGEEDWEHYPNQASNAISFTEGDRIYFEVRHVHSEGLDHAALGWKSPGSTEIQIIPTTAIEPYLAGLTNLSGLTGDRKFFRVRVSDLDQDGDGITDWAEKQMAGNGQFFFADATTQTGTNDGTLLTAALANVEDPDLVSLIVSDAGATENNTPLTGDDHGTMVISRSQGLQPLTVRLSTENVAHPEESAESGDYTLENQDGSPVGTTVTLAFGQTSHVMTVRPIPDAIHEYPETVRMRLLDPITAGDYEVDLQDVADVLLYDRADHQDNKTLFVGGFSKDANCGGVTNGNGFVSALLNGPKTQLEISNHFNNLTSPQQDSHVHKSNPSQTSGSIVYAITRVPGGESGPEPGSLPFIGEITAYPWELTETSGAVPTGGGAASRQTLIDSLFQENGETPLYLNVHTVDNAAGEIWAFLNETTGTSSDPGDADPPADPGSAEFPQITETTALEQEIRRFLNQATFGSTDSEVASLLATIKNERLTNSSYHRVEAFEAWIDEQIDVIPQTYIKDQTLAADLQEWKLRGFFDPTRNPSGTYNGTMVDTPGLPAAWAAIDRSSSNPEEWFPTVDYPLANIEMLLGHQVNDLGQPSGTNRRRTQWNMYLNARDQLRQKMGYALQQIVVTSASANTLFQRTLGTAHYLDMLNHYAFEYYRDVFGYVNWSPVMGRWLSSLKNQRAFDIDGDLVNDVFPDENLAREDLQLFSIGLFVLWSDGSLKLGNDGLPIPTYTNDDIQEFARVLTGQSFGKYTDTRADWGVSSFAEVPENTNFNRGNGNPYYGHHYNYPMKMFGIYHDQGVKTMPGGKVIDNTSIIDPEDRGIADIEAAMDWLSGKPGDGNPDFNMAESHQSTPAFISRRLIQRFVTSNPTQGYLHRVATAFKNGEGNLGATIKAILLDPEARVVDLSSTVFGMKKPPLEAHIQLLKAFEAYSLIPLQASTDSPFDTAPGDYSNPDIHMTNFGYPPTEIAKQKRNARYSYPSTHTGESASLDMTPYHQDTVFNWFLPDHSPGGPIASAALVAPEMQLANEVGVIKNINYLRVPVVTWNPATGVVGQGVNSLGGTARNQQLALGQTTDGIWDNNDRVRFDTQDWANLLYPSTTPTATTTRSSESLADEILMDALDKRLTLGFFKERYPYDPRDDGVDDVLMNPREILIDYLTEAYGNPFNGANDDGDRNSKFRFGLHLLSVTPEYLIKK